MRCSKLYLVVAAVVVLACATGVKAQALNLNSGAITIDTDALTITGSATATGTLDAGVATFDFSSINLGSGVAVTLQGNNPLSLNSTGDITIGTIFDASGANGQNNINNPGGSAGFGGVGILGGGNGGQAGQISSGTAGAGPGGGGGQTNCCDGGSGGSFGGLGGVALNAAASTTYGDAQLTVLQGGSGGGGGAGTSSCCEQDGSGGGAGGGAIEFRSENGSIELLPTGQILVNGGDGGNTRPGGGGSGGAIKLDAGTELIIDGLLSALGGDTTDPTTRPGGAGGGGRIALFAPELEIGGFDIAEGNINDSAFVTVLGGNGSDTIRFGSTPHADGSPGTALFTVQESRAVPEPASIAMWILGALSTVAFAVKRRKRKFSSQT